MILDERSATQFVGSCDKQLGGAVGALEKQQLRDFRLSGERQLKLPIAEVRQQTLVKRAVVLELPAILPEDVVNFVAFFRKVLQILLVQLR